MYIETIKENLSGILTALCFAGLFLLILWVRSGGKVDEYMSGSVVRSSQSRTGPAKGYVPPFTSIVELNNGEKVSVGSLRLLKTNEIICVQLVKNASGTVIQYSEVERELCRS